MLMLHAGRRILQVLVIAAFAAAGMSLLTEQGVDARGGAAETMRLAVDLSSQGWSELRDARPGLPFMKVIWMTGILAENAWPNKVVVHSRFLRRGSVARTAQRGIELRETSGFTRLGTLPLSDLIPDDVNIGRGQVVPASQFLACATGKHLEVDPSLFSGVDLRRVDALFVSVEPGDPKAREQAVARPLLIHVPALDGASK